MKNKIHLNRYIWTILSLCFLINNTLHGQDSLQYVREIPVKSTFIQIDQLQQLYVLQADQSLIKFDAKGEQIFEYSNSLLGTPSFVDVTDPLNIALYYIDFQTVVLLDRNLTELQVISLFELGFSQVSSIALSNNQKIWLYDETDFKFKKIDRRGRVIFESSDTNLGIGKSIHPTVLMERDNRLFANDPEQGIFVFDLFGQYLYSLPLWEVSYFQLFDQHIIYYANAKLKTWGLQSKLEQTLASWKTAAAIHQVVIDKKGHFYLRKENAIEIWEQVK